jgi:hypothetical protein
VVTHELRWFVAQAISDDELRKFAATDTLERRCDRYLHGTNELRGVKQRGGGGLEDKRRTASFVLSFDLDGRAVHGSIERWYKSWPRELEPAPGLTHKTWIDVHKRRALLVRDACRVELTGLHIALDGFATTEFQSLAFETLTDDDPVAALSSCAHAVLRERPQLLARIIDQPSIGYPAWLGSLAP